MWRMRRTTETRRREDTLHEPTSQHEKFADSTEYHDK